MNLRTGLNNTPYIEQPRASAPLGADWSVEINLFIEFDQRLHR